MDRHTTGHAEGEAARMLVQVEEAAGMARFQGGLQKVNGRLFAWLDNVNVDALTASREQWSESRSVSERYVSRMPYRRQMEPLFT